MNHARQFSLFAAPTWEQRTRNDVECREIADRHYNRQHAGAPRFAPPGRCLVLLHHGPEGKALWITSWPFAEYVKHAWAGAWVCSCFRNESGTLSSDLIVAAVNATVERWPDVPALGMITFVDREKTRRKRDPGRCYRRAGFVHVGETKGGLVALQLTQQAIEAIRESVGR